MKKLFFPVLFVVIIISCTDNNTTEPFVNDELRVAAYSSLSDIQKESITINWKEAQVIRGYYSTKNCTNAFVSSQSEMMCFELNNSNLDLKESQTLGAVVFNTNNDPLLGPMVVIVEPKNNVAIGFVLRY